MLPLETVNNFIQRIHSAKMSGSKEIKIDLNSALDIASALSLMIANNSQSSEKITDLQHEIIKLQEKAANQKIEVSVNPGRKW